MPRRLLVIGAMCSLISSGQLTTAQSHLSLDAHESATIEKPIVARGTYREFDQNKRIRVLVRNFGKLPGFADVDVYFLGRKLPNHVLYIFARSKKRISLKPAA